VIAWRKEMEIRCLSPASIRRKLSALSSLFDYLCERNAVAGNPVDGVKRPLRTIIKAAHLPLVTIRPAVCSMPRRATR
jgi:site-specific recombinase XerC